MKSEVFFAGSVDRKISSTFDIPGSDRKPTWKMRSFKNPLQCAALVQTQVISLPPAFAINYKAGLISCLSASHVELVRIFFLVASFGSDYHLATHHGNKVTQGMICLICSWDVRPKKYT